MKNKNTGLPCPFCGEKLKRLDASVSPDGTQLFVRINWAFAKNEVLKEMKALVSLIKSMVAGMED